MTPLVLILLLTDMQINLVPEKVLERGIVGNLGTVFSNLT
mgnify:CR=1 FL=1